VTFTAPNSAASASFGGSASATVVTGSTGVAIAPALTANGQTGSYVVTASAAGMGSAAFSLANTSGVTGSGGLLSGSGTSSAAAVNLTAEGGLDWAHWGDGSLNRKAGVTAQISSDSVIGAGSVLTYTNDPRPVSWTDGTPTPAGGNNMNGIYINGAGQGFSFTAPAGTTARTLAVHVGGWNSGGTLTAHLSDGSAPDFVDVTTAASGQYDRNYTLCYSAGTAGQTMKVSWVMSSGNGNVTLNAAALAGASVTATAGTPQSTAVGTEFSTALQATVSDGGGNPVSGAVVTFTAPGSGPTANFAGSASVTATTNSSGVAIAPASTAGTQAGAYQVTASVAGLANSASFSLTNLAAGPASIAATAGTPQNATLNTAFAAALQATVKDAGGNPLSGVTVTFAAPTTGASATFGGSATVTTNASGVATAPALTANGQAGSYTVTASVASVTTPVGFSLTNTPATTGGSGTLSGSANSNSGTFNLTTEGVSDWVNWGVISGGPGLADRKRGVTAQISNYKEIGSQPVGTTGNDPRTLTWSDGTPNVSGSNNVVVCVDSNSGHSGNGFSFTVPAGTTTRTLVVHAGGQNSGGTLTVSLSDGSAANYQDTTADQSGRWDRNYTINYSAASAGQTLTIQWVNATASGNVSLGGAALQ
jgi:hypothetical protein